MAKEAAGAFSPCGKSYKFDEDQTWTERRYNRFLEPNWSSEFGVRSLKGFNVRICNMRTLEVFGMFYYKKFSNRFKSNDDDDVSKELFDMGIVNSYYTCLR